MNSHIITSDILAYTKHHLLVAAGLEVLRVEGETKPEQNPQEDFSTCPVSIRISSKTTFCPLDHSGLKCSWVIWGYKSSKNRKASAAAVNRRVISLVTIYDSWRGHEGGWEKVLRRTILRRMPR